MRDLELNEKIPGGAYVDKQYYSSLDVETVKLRKGRNCDEQRVINEMKKRGWTYHFTRDVGKYGKMWFRDAEEWDMEPGAGNS